MKNESRECEARTTIGKRCVKAATGQRQHTDGHEYSVCTRHGKDKAFIPFELKAKAKPVWNGNVNHPAAGSKFTIEPIVHKKDIEAIKAILATNPRDLALFTIGINTNLRASDLVRLTVGQVQHIKAGDDLEITEKKTGKKRRITLNKACTAAIQSLLAFMKPIKPEGKLFQGQRNDSITAIYVNHLVKKWTAAINLPGRYGAHTLRKTWGYHQRVTFGVDIPTLMTCFNHSTQKQTLDYLCVQDAEIKSVYENCL